MEKIKYTPPPPVEDKKFDSDAAETSQPKVELEPES